MAQKDFDYTKKAAELEEIVTKLQDPEIQIDEAARLHAAGLKLVEDLESYLQQAEITINKHVSDSE